MIKKIKYFIKQIIEIIKSIIYKSCYRVNSFFSREFSYKVLWDENDRNFGDILTPLILESLTDKKIMRIKKPYYYPFDHYLVIGSILQRATQNSLVWGSGFIENYSEVINKPKKVYAVRGPKSRDKLLKLGIDCPEIYGDPALLMPLIYSPEIDKKYKLGIVAHYIDKDSDWLRRIRNENLDGILIIDIQCDNPLDFVNSLLSCEKIASSSLHGIIVADAYSIPSIWLEFSKNVKGNGFKFFDYFLSVGRKDTGPLIVERDTTILDISSKFYDYKIHIDLDKLLKNCPFYDRKSIKVIK